MEKSKRIETSLPEAMIQHIQSFLSGKEAAQTTLVSKSWYNAWLTRPSLAFDQRDFKDPGRGWSDSGDKLFAFAMKTMRRYQALNLKIESLRLQTLCRDRVEQITHRLIVKGLELGATDLDLEALPPSVLSVPQEVLQSDTLHRLSVKHCEIGEKFKCSTLRSLSLYTFITRSGHPIRHMVSSCVLIEELSISNSSSLKLSRNTLCVLDKLKRLHIEMVGVDYSFFDDFDSRFPCLTDVSLVRCQYGYKSIRVSSTSLRRLSIVQSEVMKGKFVVPNLASFTYLGKRIPAFSVKAREFESHISLKTKSTRQSLWFLRLHKFLNQLSPPRINLSLNGSSLERDGDFEVVEEAVVVEDLTIEADFDRGCGLLVGLFRICRPKFVSHMRHSPVSPPYYAAGSGSGQPG